MRVQTLNLSVREVGKLEANSVPETDGEPNFFSKAIAVSSNRRRKRNVRSNWSKQGKVVTQEGYAAGDDNSRVFHAMRSKEDAKEYQEIFPRLNAPNGISPRDGMDWKDWKNSWAFIKWNRPTSEEYGLPYKWCGIHI